MIKNKYILKGFTLSETLANMIIVSSISLSMMFVFIQLKEHFEIEDNRTSVISYANRVLDELAFELSKAEQINFSNNRQLINLSYPNNNQIKTYRISENYGISRVVNGSDVIIDESYIPSDGHDRIKYKISSITFVDSVGFDAELIGLNITSSALRDVLNSSYTINMEIELFDKYEHKMEVLRFNRRVFSPSKLLYSPINL